MHHFCYFDMIVCISYRACVCVCLSVLLVNRVVGVCSLFRLNSVQIGYAVLTVDSVVIPVHICI